VGAEPFDGTDPAQVTESGFGPHVAVEVERSVAAPMPRVWEVLRDYRGARARLLTAHFADYVILDGGHGAGTVIGYRLRACSGPTRLSSRNRARGASCASAPAGRRSC
jgi:hypothetical protein